LDQHALEVSEGLSREYAALVRDGLWASGLRQALEAFMVQLTGTATGDVIVILDQGRIEVQE
jgi:argininosuccinate synthase